MPLFRFHRGSLTDSLETTIIIKDVDDLLEKIAEWWCSDGFPGATRDSMYHWQIKIHPEEKFDDRCGWYTHIVSFQVRNSEWMPVGMVSEPLDKEVWCSCSKFKEAKLFDTQINCLI